MWTNYGEVQLHPSPSAYEHGYPHNGGLVIFFCIIRPKSRTHQQNTTVRALSFRFVIVGVKINNMFHRASNPATEAMRRQREHHNNNNEIDFFPYEDNLIREKIYFIIMLKLLSFVKYSRKTQQ